MKIKLISKKQYNTLLSIYEKSPNLFLQNKGYETIDKSKLTNEDLNNLNKVENILKNHITGFIKFNNFKLDRNNNIVLRLQYDWTAHDRSLGIPFTGVGYIKLSELLNGFETKNK